MRASRQPVRWPRSGKVVGVRTVRGAGRSLGSARLNGISTASDGPRLWVTYVGKPPGSDGPIGGVLELPAF